MSRTSQEEAKTIIHDLTKAQNALDDAEYTAKNYVKDPVLIKKLGEMKLNVTETKNDLSKKLNAKNGG